MYILESVDRDYISLSNRTFMAVYVKALDHETVSITLYKTFIFDHMAKEMTIVLCIADFNQVESKEAGWQLEKKIASS